MTSSPTVRGKPNADCSLVDFTWNCKDLTRWKFIWLRFVLYFFFTFYGKNTYPYICKSDKLQTTLQTDNPTDRFLTRLFCSSKPDELQMARLYSVCSKYPSQLADTWPSCSAALFTLPTLLWRETRAQTHMGFSGPHLASRTWPMCLTCPHLEPAPMRSVAVSSTLAPAIHGKSDKSVWSWVSLGLFSVSSHYMAAVLQAGYPWELRERPIN